MPKEVRLRRVEVVVRVWVVRELVSMRLFSSTPFVPRRHEHAMCKEYWPRAFDDLKSHDSVVRHTKPHGSGAEPILNTVAHILEEVPLLRLRCVLRGVVSAVISAASRVEGKHVDT